MEIRKKVRRTAPPFIPRMQRDGAEV